MIKCTNNLGNYLYINPRYIVLCWKLDETYWIVVVDGQAFQIEDKNDFDDLIGGRIKIQ